MCPLAVRLSVLLTLVFCACPCWGQDRSNRYARFLERLDVNGDGVLETGEVSDRARRYIERLAQRAGLDASRPLAISRLLNPTDGKDGDDKDGGRTGRSSSGSGDSSAGVPGFGQPDELVKVPGFDIPLGTQPLAARYSAAVIREAESILRRYDRDDSEVLEAGEIRRGNWRNDPKSSDLNGDGELSKEELCERVASYRAERDGTDNHRKGSSGQVSSGGSSTSFGKSDSSSAGSSERLRSYADSLMRRYDKNKDGVLDKDERSQMSGDPSKADNNNDGVITKDELIVRLANYGRGSSSASPATPSKSSSSSKRRPYSDSRRRSDDEKPAAYRATAPTARLPKGLPSWFARNDANEDGQISMSEYASDWSDSKAAEFTCIDTSGDGVITPTECLAAEAAKKRQDS